MFISPYNERKSIFLSNFSKDSSTQLLEKPVNDSKTNKKTKIRLPSIDTKISPKFFQILDYSQNQKETESLLFQTKSTQRASIKNFYKNSSSNTDLDFRFTIPKKNNNEIMIKSELLSKKKRLEGMTPKKKLLKLKFLDEVEKTTTQLTIDTISKLDESNKKIKKFRGSRIFNSQSDKIDSQIQILTPNFLPKKKIVIPNYIMENKMKMIIALHLKEPNLILDALFENMAVAIQSENLPFLCDTLYLIGDFYVFANDIKNAIYSYHHLNCLAEMISFPKVKVKCLINLSICCKKLKKYDKSIRFLKKALQYAWHYRFDSKELKIYDEIGLIYFLTGDIVRAKYYHERFVNSALESDNSPCKYSSEEVFEKIALTTESINTTLANFSNVNVMILTKLGLNKEWDGNSSSPLFKRKVETNTIEDNHTTSFFYKRKIKTEHRPYVNFYTNMSSETQIESILLSKEFQYDISSPRYPNQTAKISTINPKIHKATKSINIIFNKTLDKLDPSKKKPKVIIIEDPMKKNIPLEKKIDFRMNDEWKQYNIEKTLKARFSNCDTKQEKGCLYNHLTPNRNLSGFDYQFGYKCNYSQINKYYEKLKKSLLMPTLETQNYN